MVDDPHKLPMLEIFRYPKPSTLDPELDGRPNFFAATAAGELPKVQLESGINAPGATNAIDGPRRGAILIRSTPWKAGSASTPWHDVFDLNNGHVRYFGDHKAASKRPLGLTPGNKVMLEAFKTHAAMTREERELAPPLILFRAVTTETTVKGYVEFAGVAVIERIEQIVQWDERLRRSYPNYVYDLAVLDLSTESETLDWRWINKRRDKSLTAKQALTAAPYAWRRWVTSGSRELPRIRRRLTKSPIMPEAEQRPHVGSKEALVLKQVYDAFAGKKHAFEAVASAVAARVLGGGGAVYLEGWLTRPSGDRGIDFVGRLDVGSGEAQTKLVVLGQAKCTKPEKSSVSAEQLARVVARLRRGWIGVYVTTGIFSRPAQQEINDDEYPIVLIHGRRLADEVRQMAHENHEGNVPALLNHLVSTGLATISQRRPEEILFISGLDVKVSAQA